MFEILKIYEYGWGELIICRMFWNMLENFMNSRSIKVHHYKHYETPTTTEFIMRNIINSKKKNWDKLDRCNLDPMIWIGTQTRLN